ncbi:RyR domain-containing protein [Actinomycetospora flava]|uniref:RyR domain-containing protein n=1 Tax=Actinomycetospora flava TaxID=3129232 RepID=A0ABU8MDL0_9PSEU
MTTPNGAADAGFRSSEREALARLAVGVVALVALILGIVGFARFLPAPGVEAGDGWTDILYYTLQLFLLDSAPLQQASDLPVELDIARFLAPSTTFLAVWLTAKAVYDSTYFAVRARRLHDHTVVCGRGTSALLVARSVAEEGRTCVMVDGSPIGNGAPRHADVADARVRVLGVGGDPRNAQVLREARVHRAREIVVATGDSTLNADVTAGLRNVLEGVAEPPPCYLEMTSPALGAALAAHELTSESAVRVEVFVPADRAARRLLDLHLPVGDHAGSVLVLGSGVQFDAVVGEMDRRADRRFSSAPLSVATASDAPGADVPDDLAVAIVCVDDDLVAVQAGLRLMRSLRDCSVDVVVVVGSSTSLGATITGEDFAVSSIGRARFHVFNSTEHVYAVTSLRQGLYLDIARAAHDGYVRAARRRGETVDDNPSTVPWGDLPDDLRQANLAQAFSISDKLRALGCAVVPRDAADTPFEFDAGEVEELAKAEHERWARERRGRGWRHGERDDVSLTHPDLVTWDELDETARQKDRDVVAAIPDHLRRAGLQIIRGGPAIS